MVIKLFMDFRNSIFLGNILFYVFFLQKLAVIVLCAILSIANGYKILFMVPFSGPSHWILLQNFAKELVDRGHEVTAIVNAPIKNFKSPNYTEILIDPPLDLSSVG